MSNVVKQLLHASQQQIGSFVHLCQGRRRWTRGYGAYRDARIRKLIYGDALAHLFRPASALPEGLGVGLDERVIEFPWVLSKLGVQREKGSFLDAGSTLNHEMILQHPFVKSHKWTLLTLAPESECFWDLGVSYVYEDLRRMPFASDWFDGAFCISVLEHVGMDNALYSENDAFREDKPGDYLRAVDEMKRVLKPNCWLYVTVPFGRYEHHGWLQQFDSTMIADMISRFHPQSVTKTFYRYTQQGWQLATEDECADLSYFDIHARRFSRNGTSGTAESAVAASAVACIEMQK